MVSVMTQVIVLATRLLILVFKEERLTSGQRLQHSGKAYSSGATASEVMGLILTGFYLFPLLSFPTLLHNTDVVS